MYRNIKPLCYVPGTDTAMKVNYTLKTNKLIEKEIRPVVTRGWGRGDVAGGRN